MTTLRLFLSRREAIAMGVLLMAEYGWNLSVIDHAEVPRALPDPGEDGHPTYHIPLEKARRGPGNQFETRNVTDDGAASNGRLITQALQATRFARAVGEQLAPGTDLLVVWRAIVPGATAATTGPPRSARSRSASTRSQLTSGRQVWEWPPGLRSGGVGGR